MLRVGQIIGRYVVDGLLGRGGMATVWRVVHTDFGTVHALKVLQVADASHQARLRREGRLQAAIDHPNVVRVTDRVDVDGELGLVLDYVDGPSLDRVIRATRLTTAQADHVLRGVLRGVAAAHDRGAMHRDLKPANVLLDLTGRAPVPRVADFGLAKALDDVSQVLTRSGMAVGTPAYMSPEQVRGGEVGTASDVFALGVIATELVTGERAFRASSPVLVMRAIVEGEPPPLPADVPARMRRAIVEALQKDPAARPPDAAALLALWVAGTPAPEGVWSTSAMRRLIAISTGVTETRAPTATFDPQSLDLSATPTPTTAGVVPHVLPAERDTFVGRRAELGALAASLRAATRVSVVGPAGCGKTRLVSRAAWGALSDFPGGVYFVDLTDCADLDAAAAAIVGVLGLRVRGSGIGPVASSLAGRRRTLIVLDNLEQLGDASGGLDGLGAGAPDVVLLGTSRHAVGWTAEVVHRLEPLPVPDDDEETAAVRLFVERARAADRAFVADDTSRRRIAGIVRELDGLPLAIELAAARLRVMSLDRLATRLADRFRVLHDRGARPRHRTLRAALDGSWELADPALQQALAELSVFPGPFTLESAEDVLDPDLLDDGFALDLVEELVERSLLRTLQMRGREAGDVRFGMYTSVRAYAAEKLAAMGADAVRAVQRRLVGAYLGARGPIGANIERRLGVARRIQLGDELPNLFEAASLAADLVDPMDWLRMLDAVIVVARDERGVAGRLRRLLRAGPLDTGAGADARGWWLGQDALYSQLTGAEDAVACRDAAEAALDWMPAGQARALVRRIVGMTLLNGGHVARAVPVLRAALAESRETGFDTTASAHHLLGLALQMLGRADEAEACYRAGLAEASESDATSRFLGHHRLAHVLATKGDLDGASAELGSALAAAEQLRDPVHIAAVRVGAGHIASLRGELDVALAHFDTALQVSLREGHSTSVGLSAVNLGEVLRRLGRHAAARAVLAQARAHSRRRGKVHEHLVCSEARIALAEGRFDRAFATLDVLELDASDRGETTLPFFAVRARALGGLGRSDEARESLEWARAALRTPPDPVETAMVDAVAAALDPANSPSIDDVRRRLADAGYDPGLIADLGPAPS